MHSDSRCQARSGDEFVDWPRCGVLLRDVSVPLDLHVWQRSSEGRKLLLATGDVRRQLRKLVCLVLQIIQLVLFLGVNDCGSLQ